MVRRKKQHSRGDSVGAICGISVKTRLAIKGSKDSRHHSLQPSGRLLLGGTLIIPSIKILKPGESRGYQHSCCVEGRGFQSSAYLSNSPWVSHRKCCQKSPRPASTSAESRGPGCSGWEARGRQKDSFFHLDQRFRKCGDKRLSLQARDSTGPSHLLLLTLARNTEQALPGDR